MEFGKQLLVEKLFVEKLFVEQLVIAISLMLVLEGILPFLYPQRWRNLVARLSEIDDRQLRIAGFISMVAGLILLTLAT